MRKTSCGSGILALATLAAACSHTLTAEAHSPVGCYRLTIGAWDHPPEEPVIPLPDSITLMDVRGTDALEDDRLLVRPYPASVLQYYRWSWWQPVDGDSLRVVWSTGFSGVDMRLGRAGDDYSGRARNFVDYPIDASTATVTLDRFTCS